MKEFVATVLPSLNNFGADSIIYDRMDVRRRNILTDTWRGSQQNHFTGANPLN